MSLFFSSFEEFHIPRAAGLSSSSGDATLRGCSPSGVKIATRGYEFSTPQCGAQTIKAALGRVLCHRRHSCLSLSSKTPLDHAPSCGSVDSSCIIPFCGLGILSPGIPVCYVMRCQACQASVVHS